MYIEGSRVESTTAPIWPLVGVSLLKKLSDELALGVFFIQIQGYPSLKKF